MLVHMMLEASGLRVLVVGGGAVAARKAGQLLAGGAERRRPGRKLRKIVAGCPSRMMKNLL